MSMGSVRNLVITVLFVLLFAVSPASAKRADGVFTEVRDANVVVLDYGEGTYDIRIYGTEAPADGQPFAAEAKAFVREALLGKSGAMRFKYKNAKEQMVARVFYYDDKGQERDLGVDLAAAGLAWLRPGARYRPVEEGQPDQLTAAQTDAQEARRGVWSAANPVAPWTYRGETLPTEGEMNGLTEGVEGTLDINISKLSGSDNECAIVKNPTNPLQLAAHCNSLATPWRSSDGGATWVLGGSIGSYCCDPNLAWDNFGNLYATFINGGTNAIVTMLSVDGGAVWNPLASFSGSIDQPSIVAHDGMVWIVWNQSGAMVARGAPVTGLGVANVGTFVPLQTAANTGGCSFGDLASSPVAPHAIVQVCGPQTGQVGGDIRINVDVDGLGAGTFGASSVAATTLVGGFDFIPAQDNRSVDTESGLTFDRNPASPHFGRLYLIYTDELIQESNDTNVMLTYSDNITATPPTWSTPIQINTDATVRSQFLPKIASDPATGNVAICWHDTRDSATNTAMEIWCDSFTPATFPTFLGNVQVSDGASISTDSAMDFGDYNGLTLTNGTAHAVWADSSNSTGDNPNGTTALDTYTGTYSVLTSDYTLAATPPSLAVCAPANAVFNVNVGAFGGYIDQVTLSATGNPAGTTTGFSVNPVTPAGTSVLTIGNTAGGTPGTTSIAISAASTSGPKSVFVSLSLATAVPGAPALTAPANGATGVATQPTLTWAADPASTSYLVEVSDDPTFATVDYSTTVSGSSHLLTSSLSPSTVYHWRITGNNACGTTPSAARSFTTANILSICGGPITINDAGVATPYPSVATVGSIVGEIVGLELTLTGYTHTFPDDVDMLLVSPSGEKMIFMSDVGGSADISGLNISLADSAAVVVPDGGPLAVGTFRPSDVDAVGTFPAPAPAGPYSSATPVGSATFTSAFAAATVSGNWSLYILDDAGVDVGSITQWCLNAALSDPTVFTDGFEAGNTGAWSLAVP